MTLTKHTLTQHNKAQPPLLAGRYQRYTLSFFDSGPLIGRQPVASYISPSPITSSSCMQAQHRSHLM